MHPTSWLLLGGTLLMLVSTAWAMLPVPGERKAWR
jgi:hypothetical protein